jgi:hypothetical protein
VFSTANIVIGIITGAFGLAYFVYGKKQSEMVFLVSGIGLMVYPYLFSSLALLIIVGLLLLALPFLLKQKSNYI